MRRLFALALAAGLALVATDLPNPTLPPNEASAALGVSAWGGSPIVFEANMGQVDARASFVIRATDKSLFFEDDGITFDLSSPPGPELEGPPDSWAVKLRFVGAHRVAPVGLDRQEMVVSYFHGSPEDWTAGVPTFGRIVYHDLWDGIDLEYGGTADALKYTFHVAAGADPSKIRLTYEGAEVGLDERGRIRVNTPVAAFHDTAPTAFQDLEGARIDVDARFDVTADEAGSVATFGFDLGDYDPTRPLVIDPAVLVYCGYITGTADTGAMGIAVDATGAAYVTGWVGGQSGVPAVVGPDTSHNGGNDAFVAKIKPDGTGFVYVGFIGGPGTERGAGIAVDAQGSAYVTGEARYPGLAPGTSNGFPVTGALDPTFNGGEYDMWFAKVSASGLNLEVAGFVGGASMDRPGWGPGAGYGYGSPIAVDDQGDVYLTGTTTSTNHPAATAMVGVDHALTPPFPDAFLLKLELSPSPHYVYGTYIGGSQPDAGSAVAVDDEGSAYVVGVATQNFSQGPGGFPVVRGPDLSSNLCGGCAGTEGFITKVRADGTAFEYSGFIGGDGAVALDVAVDDAHAAYVVGFTNAPQGVFPDGDGFDWIPGFDQVYSGTGVAFNVGRADGFLVKVKPEPDQHVPATGAAQEALEYATYIGGRGDSCCPLASVATSVEVNAAGEAMVAGWTAVPQSFDFPLVGGPDSTFNGGADDAFVMRFAADGTRLLQSGYLGGGVQAFDHDRVYDLALDAFGGTYVAGHTNSSPSGGFPTVVGPTLGFISPHNGTNTFLAKLGIDEPQLIADAGGPYQVIGGEWIPLTATASEGAIEYAWDLDDDGIFETAEADAIYAAPVVAGVETRTLHLRVCNAQGDCAIDDATVDIRPCELGPDAPDHWWPGDGHAKDVIGGAVASARGDAGYGPGVVGTAFALDGDDDAYELTQAASDQLLPGATGFTIEGWVYRTGGFAIFEDHFSCIRFESVMLAASQFIVNAGNSLATRQVVTFPEIPLGAWTHVAAVWDGATSRVYLDGQLAASGAAPNPPWNPENAFVIGARRTTGTCFAADGEFVLEWTGNIDELAYHRRALSASEIEALSDLESFGRCGPTNQPPVVEAGGPYAGDEGSPIALDGSAATDPDEDALTYSWSVDVPWLCSFDDASALHPMLTCEDNGDFTVTLAVDDGIDPAVTDDATVSVANVAPIVGAVSVPAVPIDIDGPPVTGVSGVFTDAGVADTHACTVDYGDGTGALAGTAVGGTCTGPAHDYASPGVYTVTVTVTDDDGGIGSATAIDYVVIFDPNSGFVTGGGWIESPAGAYVADPALTGKANFGFVSKYENGALAPTGQTSFQFRAGDLQFVSTRYDWLVVPGHDKAKFKGEGMVNGVGNYDFMLTAVDNGNAGDTFRIKITGPGGLVYDNRIGSSDDGYDGTVIGGGNIKVHKR